MKKLSDSIGDRINKFDNLTNPTVLDYNVLFYECPIIGFDPDLPVTIGEYVAGNKREIFVDKERIVCKMYSDIMYGVDRDDYNNEQDQEAIEILGHPV